MHYQSLFIKCSPQKISKFKTLSFCQKIIFSASHFFMHIFNMPVTFMQNIKEIQCKFLEELITQSMHYQPLYNHLIVRITKGHYSANTDPLAPIFLSHVHCVMVQVWCKFYKKSDKRYGSSNAKTLFADGMTELQNFGHTENRIPR